MVTLLAFVPANAWYVYEPGATQPSSWYDSATIPNADASGVQVAFGVNDFVYFHNGKLYVRALPLMADGSVQLSDSSLTDEILGRTLLVIKGNTILASLESKANPTAIARVVVFKKIDTSDEALELDVAEAAVGVPGVPTLSELEAAEAAPVPAELMAATVNV